LAKEVSKVPNIIEQTQQTMQQIGKISSLNPQLTYSYVIRDTFYQLVPGEFKQYYYHNIRQNLNWYQGYVPEFHDPRNGIFSTRIANSVVKEITKLIVGGKVFFANRYKEKNPENNVNEDLETWLKYVDQYNIQDFVRKLVEYAAAGGTSLIVENINLKGHLVPKVMRIDQCFYTTDFSGEVMTYTGFLKSYTADVDKGNGRDKFTNNYYLLETRYYNDKNEPVIRINVKSGLSSVVTAQSFDAVETTDCQWEQLPKRIKEKIKRDYGNMFRIGEEKVIPFEDLGVIVAKYTATNTIPEVDMGESAIANVISYFIAYEQAFAEMITDLYLARGKVLLPQQMSNPLDPSNAYYSDFDGMLFTKFPYMGQEEQKPQSIQFELRAEEWVKVRNNFVESIASQIGVSGSDIFSYLRDASGSSKTATQIASEAQKTISYIEEKRAMFTGYINRFIQHWKKYNKIDDDFGVKFSTQNHVNKLVSTEEVRVMHEVGFDLFTIYGRFFSDLDDAQVQEMVNRKYREVETLERIKAKVNMEAFEQAVPQEENGKPIGKGTNIEKDEEEIELRE
jgi:hypothetical protein